MRIQKAALKMRIKIKNAKYMTPIRTLGNWYEYLIDNIIIRGRKSEIKKMILPFKNHFFSTALRRLVKYSDFLPSCFCQD